MLVFSAEAARLLAEISPGPFFLLTLGQKQEILIDKVTFPLSRDEKTSYEA